MRAASFIVAASSSAAGTASFASPHCAAVRPSMVSPVNIRAVEQQPPDPRLGRILVDAQSAVFRHGRSLKK
jgi:hypothetical protein